MRNNPTFFIAKSISLSVIKEIIPIVPIILKRISPYSTLLLSLAFSKSASLRKRKNKNKENAGENEKWRRKDNEENHTETSNNIFLQAVKTPAKHQYQAKNRLNYIYGKCLFQSGS